MESASVAEAQQHEKAMVAYSGVDCLWSGVLFADALRAGGVLRAWGHGGMEEWGHVEGLDVVPVGAITVYVHSTQYMDCRRCGMRPQLVNRVSSSD